MDTKEDKPTTNYPTYHLPYDPLLDRQLAIPTGWCSICHNELYQGDNIPCPHCTQTALQEGDYLP